MCEKNEGERKNGNPSTSLLDKTRENRPKSDDHPAHQKTGGGVDGQKSNRLRMPKRATQKSQTKKRRQGGGGSLRKKSNSKEEKAGGHEMDSGDPKPEKKTKRHLRGKGVQNKRRTTNAGKGVLRGEGGVTTSGKVIPGMGPARTKGGSKKSHTKTSRKAGAGKPVGRS